MCVCHSLSIWQSVLCLVQTIQVHWSGKESWIFQGKNSRNWALPHPHGIHNVICYHYFLIGCSGSSAMLPKTFQPCGCWSFPWLAYWQLQAQPLQQFIVLFACGAVFKSKFNCEPLKGRFFVKPMICLWTTGSPSPCLSHINSSVSWVLLGTEERQLGLPALNSCSGGLKK